MKILYLAHRIPYPPNKGDKIRSFHEIKYLSKNHKIHLCCLADNPKDLQYKKTLRNFCDSVYIVSIYPKIAKLKSIPYLLSNTPLSVPYFYSRKLQKMINHLLKTTPFDRILCFSSPMAEYIFRSKIPTNLIPPLIMDFCDVDSHKWAQYARASTFPLSFIYKLEGYRLADYEKRIGEQFDYSVVVSKKEADIFQNQNPHIPQLTVIGNGVDYEYFNPDNSYPLPSKLSNLPDSEYKYSRPVLLFTGAMDYHANIDAVLWFCKKIFPQIKKNIPEVRFYIVGSNPHKDIRNLQNGNNIIVTGFVEDIRPYYQKADICVTPLRLGQGVQNKVLEAMAMGKAIVTTAKATEGIKVMSGKHLYIADDPATISHTILMLLKDKTARKRLGTKARRYIKAHCNWLNTMQKFEEIIKGDEKGG